jgi:hypothetical protein
MQKQILPRFRTGSHLNLTLDLAKNETPIVNAMFTARP